MSELQRDQVPGGRCENFVTALGNQHHVFDPYPAFAGKIDAGFNGYDHSRPQLPFLYSGKTGRLVNLESDAMSRRMRKKRAPTVLFQPSPGYRIYFCESSARPHRLDGSLLRRSDRLI